MKRTKQLTADERQWQRTNAPVHAAKDMLDDWHAYHDTDKRHMIDVLRDAVIQLRKANDNLERALEKRDATIKELRWCAGERVTP